jgi:hypothetical protein
VDRSPDFFALGRLLGDAEFWGAFDGASLVACLGVTRQRRTLRGTAGEAWYVHDVRTDPGRLRPGAVRRLFAEVMDAHRRETAWAFSVVLDSNTHRRGLTGGGRLFPPGRPIGSTVHLGLPLADMNADDPVIELAEDEAWQAFRALAGEADFAPADREQFSAMGGPCVGIRDGSGVAAVARLVDQSAARRILVVDRGPAVEFPHLYLAYYAARPGRDDRRAFAGHAAARFAGRYGYVFIGVPPEVAAGHGGPGVLSLTSTAIAYGDVPDGLRFDYRELTLI